MNARQMVKNVIINKTYTILNINSQSLYQIVGNVVLSKIGVKMSIIIVILLFL
jgi:hypothetical protein